MEYSDDILFEKDNDCHKIGWRYALHGCCPIDAIITIQKGNQDNEKQLKKKRKCCEWIDNNRNYY